MVDQITEEQIAEFREAFKAKYKPDAEGNANTTHLKAAIAEYFRPPTEALLIDISHEIDPYSTKKWDFAGFLSIIDRKLRATEDELMLIEAFAEHDKDNSGYITKQQVKQLLTELEMDDLTPVQVDRMIAEAGSNSEGKVRYANLAKLLGGE